MKTMEGYLPAHGGDRRGIRHAEPDVVRRSTLVVIPEGDHRGIQKGRPMYGRTARGCSPEERCEVNGDGQTVTLVNTRTGERTTYQAVQPHKAASGSKKQNSPEPSVDGRRLRVPLSDKRSRDIGPETPVLPSAVHTPILKDTAATTTEKGGSPFSKAIAEEVPPPNFKVSKFSVYDAKSDAPTHVQQFKSMAALCGLSEAMMCRTFSLSLPDTAMLWYTQLKPGSISSFGELERSFTARFVASNRRPKTVEALTDLRRKVGESLKDYFERFYNVYNLVESCDQKIAATSFKRGLDRNSDLSKELMLQPPNDMSDLMQTVARYIELEEYIEGSDVAKVAEQPKQAMKKQVNVVAKEGAGAGGNRGGDKARDRPPSDAQDHLAITTYFKELIFRVLRECGRLPGFQWPTGAAEKLGEDG
ncbi:hypothetical protein RHMOL_Rhmol07G0156700 [Rhododendron molle]|uniref:Uncharacterized protein n=1 Tax=Rhododendron molle TaxID=49168 RepID=A0ACC0N224_RHOML|nr:hypothetical protein RHMOL_Rhmol07G0156700 [Rhododendron molle]